MFLTSGQKEKNDPENGREIGLPNAMKKKSYFLESGRTRNKTGLIIFAKWFNV